MKVLLLSRYSRLGSSSRLRMLQYLPYLNAHGIAVAFSPLLDDAYLRDLYSGCPRRPAPLMRNYLQRLPALTRSRSYDLLWIEKELFPGFPAWAEQFLACFGVPYVVDYDDASFHYYGLHPNPVVRRLMGRKIDKVMRGASMVVAGNEYIADRARRAGAARVEILPTVVDLDRYRASSNGDGAVFTIGWIGAPCNARYLSIIEDALAEVCAGGRARVVLVGSGPVRSECVSPEVREWSESTEAADIQSFDAGVMPLPDDLWERGKCGYKLIQYMACGKPVVASPVGVNREIVQEGANGFLAAGRADWVRSLSALRDNPILREQLGRRGRELVEARYCVQATAPRLIELLFEAARRG